MQNQLAEMLTDVFASIQTPKHVSLKSNTCFQNNMCAEATLGELAISFVLLISCEPVKVESERNLSEVQRVYKCIGIPCSNILANVYIYI